VPQGQLQGGDFGLGTMGRVGDGAMLDLARLPVGLPEQMAAIGPAPLGGSGGVDIPNGYDNITNYS